MNEGSLFLADDKSRVVFLSQTIALHFVTATKVGSPSLGMGSRDQSPRAELQQYLTANAISSYRQLSPKGFLRVKPSREARQMH